MSETLAAKILDYVCENMGIEPEWSVREPSELAWWAGDLRQRIVARSTPDPDPDEGDFLHIVIETDVVRQDPIPESVAEYAVALNRVSTYSGLTLSDGDPTVLALSSTVVTWPGNVEQRKHLVLFIAAVQVAEAYGLAAELEEAVGATRASSAHPTSGPRPPAEEKIDELWRRSWDPPDPMDPSTAFGARPSLFAGPLLEECVGHLQQPPCVLCTGSETGVAAEFPFGGQTSILELRTKEAHERRMVTGLLVLDRYPVGASGDITPMRCLELGAMERDARLPGIGLGGWTFSREGVLAHVAFLPNSAARLSHPFDWLMSASMRARWLTEEVFGLPWREHFAESRKNKLEQLGIPGRDGGTSD